ncbi:MAG: hypothetical protein IKS04_04790 [Clostridia bacterium]|nr:hypothetical protein [Clostridia bacterium]
MKTYDETFERVMAERDSYMRRRKEKIKNTAVGGFALACVAFSVFAIVKAKGNSIVAQSNDRKDTETAAAKVSQTDENGEVFYYTIEDDSSYAVTLSHPETAGESIKKADKESGEETTVIIGAKEEKTKNPGGVKAETAVDSDEATVRPAASTTALAETVVSMKYTYVINSGKYKDYCPGRVIEQGKVGEKAGSVTVTGYWEGFGAVSENKTQRETLSADVYYIKGVSDDVAVCLKFNEKGDALTTNHYYVVINPKADYSPVREYVIGASSPSVSAPYDREEYTVAYTSASAVYE